MFLHNFGVFVHKTERFIYENQSKTYCSKIAVTTKQIIRKNRSIQPKIYICAKAVNFLIPRLVETKIEKS